MRSSALVITAALALAGACFAGSPIRPRVVTNAGSLARIMADPDWRML